MKRTFLLIYTTVSGTTYKEFKTFQDGPDYDTCIQRIIDEFDELAYLFLKMTHKFITLMLIISKV